MTQAVTHPPHVLAAYTMELKTADKISYLQWDSSKPCEEDAVLCSQAVVNVAQTDVGNNLQRVPLKHINTTLLLLLLHSRLTALLDFVRDYAGELVPES